VLCCTPFLSLFPISFSYTGSSPSSSIAWFSLFVLAYIYLPEPFHLFRSSFWKFHNSAAWPATLLFPRTNPCLHHPPYQNISTIPGHLLERL
jgi:hypothetical protein